MAIAEPGRLEHRGRKVYSQSDEDGILSDAEELCERVAILARGRLVVSGRVGPPSILKRSPPATETVAR